MTPAYPTSNLRALLKNLFRHISPRRRRQFLLLLGLTLIGSVTEVVSLGAVLPFIGILTEPGKVFHYPAIAVFVRAAGIKTPAGLILPLTLAFATAAITAGGVRLLLLWFGIRLANITGAELGTAVYHRTLYQPYRVHVARNSSEIISGSTQKAAAATSILVSLVAVATSSALFAAILLTLFAIDPAMAAVALAVFGTGYAITAWLMKQPLTRNSRHIAQAQTQVVKSLQEGLGAIRDVLLDGAQAVYCEVYRKSIYQLAQANGENTFMNQAPRYAMEALGMVLVAALAYAMSRRPGGVQAALPILGALALGAERLLPLLQQVYGNWTVVAGSRSSLIDVLELLDQPLPADANEPEPPALPFHEAIRFDNVRFRYTDNGPLVLDGINLTIQAGRRIGIVGSTGSGKSTTLDILMSLLEPTEGSILVDGRAITGGLRRAWQRTIAHVPQSIFLADSTIAENIAFGVRPEDIDMNRVRRAAAQAQISQFIESQPGGYGAFVGERGVRLSGGQRQRIGIARALYKQATVLVFDEATNALDSDTEKMVMSTIDNLDKNLTILMIAHRITTLQNCDMIYQLEHGKMTAHGSYAQFAAASQGKQ